MIKINLKKLINRQINNLGHLGGRFLADKSITTGSRFLDKSWCLFFLHTLNYFLRLSIADIIIHIQYLTFNFNIFKQFMTHFSREHLLIPFIICRQLNQILIILFALYILENIIKILILIKQCVVIKRPYKLINIVWKLVLD